MNFGQLLEIQASGAIKVDGESTQGVAVIGGVALNNDQCKLIANDLGWIKYDQEAFQVIDKTDKFVSHLNKHLDESSLIDRTTIHFKSTRITNTQKYYDWIKMVCPGHFDITVLRGYPGTGGTYAVLSDSNNFVTPVFTGRSVKALAGYLNTYVL